MIVSSEWPCLEKSGPGDRPYRLAPLLDIIEANLGQPLSHDDVNLLGKPWTGTVADEMHMARAPFWRV